MASRDNLVGGLGLAMQRYQRSVQAFDDAVLHSPSSETDGVGDSDAGARAVRDDDQTVESKEVATAVRLGIETLSNPPRSRTHQRAAEPATQ